MPPSVLIIENVTAYYGTNAKLDNICLSMNNSRNENK